MEIGCLRFTGLLLGDDFPRGFVIGLVVGNLTKHTAADLAVLTIATTGLDFANSQQPNVRLPLWLRRENLKRFGRKFRCEYGFDEAIRFTQKFSGGRINRRV